jgi:hypothetical protein
MYHFFFEEKGISYQEPHSTYLNNIQKFFVIYFYMNYTVLMSYFAVIAYFTLEACDKMYMEYGFLIEEIIKHANPNYLEMRARKKEREFEDMMVQRHLDAKWVMDTWCG